MFHGKVHIGSLVHEVSSEGEVVGKGGKMEAVFLVSVPSVDVSRFFRVL